MFVGNYNVEIFTLTFYKVSYDFEIRTDTIYFSKIFDYFNVTKTGYFEGSYYS